MSQSDTGSLNIPKQVEKCVSTDFPFHTKIGTLSLEYEIRFKLLTGKDMFLPSLLYSLSTYISLNSPHAYRIFIPRIFIPPTTKLTLPQDGVIMPLFPFIQRSCSLVIIAIHFYVLREEKANVSKCTSDCTISIRLGNGE